ncbi:MAG TPA: hypothetical protein PLO64_04000 [Methanothermobacter sp.]|nr:conserved hypothetical protein [Methanothermobacter sp. MT-2]HHW04683.1 hypothetical protein [Methanothermobacter sp.]HOK72839.1 hypothetical protein [Methanothermobacter sp.]HOL69076.1 hypothetical protein [Methanothermobacter sp.]HPQ04788.1 hypothetical protein [Methanothermobacter sp.]
MKVISIGADISANDTSCSRELIRNLETDIPVLVDLGAYKAALTNITGDDVVISAFVEDGIIAKINRAIIHILRENSEEIGDLEGISGTPEGAGEGISYAEAKIRQDRYPDAIILSFDTYGGEDFVSNVANSAIKAARGMDDVTDVSEEIKKGTRKIPGVGYVSDKTDDPVVIATIENMESIGVVAGAMLGAVLGNKNVYLVRRGSPSHVIPGSVIVSATAFLNGNIIDLAAPFEERTRILKV